MTTPTEPTPGEIVLRLADALADRATLERKAAQSRKLSGPRYTRERAQHRAEAHACEDLRQDLLTAGPAGLDAVVNHR